MCVKKKHCINRTSDMIPMIENIHLPLIYPKFSVLHWNPSSLQPTLSLSHEFNQHEVQDQTTPDQRLLKKIRTDAKWQNIFYPIVTSRKNITPYKAPCISLNMGKSVKTRMHYTTRGLEASGTTWADNDSQTRRFKR